MNISTFLETIYPIKDVSLKEKLKEVSRIDVFKQKAHINEDGEKDYYVRFLIEGVARGYIIDHHGKEITMDFGMEPGLPISGQRMLDGKPSEIIFEAIRPCELFSIPVDEIMRLQTQYQEIVGIYISMLAYSANHHWELRKMQYLPTAKERYEWFLQKYPGLIDIVNHTHVASFLNITPVTLSRIRNEKEQ